MKLILVRHGETIWNIQNRFQGITDTTLSKNGLQQAKLLAKRLSSERIDLIYSSKLKRTVKTAEIIKSSHKNAKLIKEKNLNEISWGLWEGLTKSEVKIKYPKMYKEREKDKFNFKVSKGESLRILKIRLKNFLSKFSRNCRNKTVLIVGHLNINRVILGILLKLSDKKLPSIKFANYSIIILKIKDVTKWK